LETIKPFEEKQITFSLNTKEAEQNLNIKFQLLKNNQIILNSANWNFNIEPLPSLLIEVNYWPFGKANGQGEIQIYNDEERLVYINKNIEISNGRGIIENINNITIDELYRIVFLKKGYLPRQNYFVFKKEGNYLKFKRLLPFDKNGDGKFSLDDILKLIKK